MELLYEKLRRIGRTYPITAATIPENADVVVIRANNVADYLHETRATLTLDDAPNAAPPFSLFWIEIDRQEFQTGFLFNVVEQDMVGEVRWRVTVTAYHSSRLLGAIVFKGIYRLEIGPSGNVISEKMATEKGLTEQEQVERRMEMGWWFVTAMFSISLMHCKNVDVVEHGPHLIKQGKRNRRGPKIKHYTLQIEPMKKVLRTEGQSETVGLKKALHICRGHFAHYDEGKKLFGKYTGTFWRPMHTRGTLEAGRIDKDYQVNRPKDDNESAA